MPEKSQKSRKKHRASIHTKNSSVVKASCLPYLNLNYLQEIREARIRQNGETQVFSHYKLCRKLFATLALLLRNSILHSA